MSSIRAIAFGAALALAGPAQASFHFMQIEQVVGGVSGDTTQQAVQLRMRLGGQNQMQFSRLRVSDVNGANAVLLIDFGAPVTNFALGDRILIASPGFAADQSPTPDFVMVATIPPSYLAGGRLTFESDVGSIVFSLCWGTYVGPTTGSADNDADGQFGPCEPGPLPSSDLRALLFSGSASALSTSNAADFALTAGAAVFTNNARVAGTLVAPPPAALGGDCDDTDPAVSPSDVEIVGNKYDDDCDGLADENAMNVPSGDTSDADGDSFSIQQGDCNDTRSDVRPGLAETVGDRRDNDCDGLADESAANEPSSDGTDQDGDSHGLFGRLFADGFES